MILCKRTESLDVCNTIQEINTVRSKIFNSVAKFDLLGELFENDKLELNNNLDEMISLTNKLKEQVNDKIISI